MSNPDTWRSSRQSQMNCSHKDDPRTTLTAAEDQRPNHLMRARGGSPRRSNSSAERGLPERAQRYLLAPCGGSRRETHPIPAGSHGQTHQDRLTMRGFCPSPCRSWTRFRMLVLRRRRSQIRVSDRLTRDLRAALQGDAQIRVACVQVWLHALGREDLVGPLSQTAVNRQ